MYFVLISLPKFKKIINICFFWEAAYEICYLSETGQRRRKVRVCLRDAGLYKYFVLRRRKDIYGFISTLMSTCLNIGKVLAVTASCIIASLQSVERQVSGLDTTSNEQLTFSSVWKKLKRNCLSLSKY